MSSRETVFFSDAQISTLSTMEEFAQDEVTQKYGVGYPTYEGCGGRWLYHNGWHTESARDDMGSIGASIGLGRSALAIGRYAMSEHDNDQGKGHEKRNAKTAIERLRRQGFSEAAAVMTGLAITGTGVVIKNGVLVAQEAIRQDYPSKEAEKIALAAACGDLGVLWKPIGPLQMHNLYREIKADSSPLLDGDFVRYLHGQMQMLKTYRYPLDEAWEVLATHYDQVMAYHDNVLGQLERGELQSWEQLNEQDVLFSRFPDDWYTRQR